MKKKIPNYVGLFLGFAFYLLGYAITIINNNRFPPEYYPKNIVVTVIANLTIILGMVFLAVSIISWIVDLIKK
jgi:hypothetical protein